MADSLFSGVFQSKLLLKFEKSHVSTVDKTYEISIFGSKTCYHDCCFRCAFLGLK